MKLVSIIRVGNTLGEGVLWDDRTQSLWWTDIQSRVLLRYDWTTKKTERYATPERLCSFGFVEGREEIVAAFETGFALYRPGSPTTLWLARLETLGSGMRMNDGRVDRQGRFWAGGMAENKAGAGRARLFCLDADGEAQARESNLTISNGLCWSPDGATMYLADSPSQTIWSYAFDAVTGHIADRSVFATTPRGTYPDGATVDAEGYVWSAQWGASRVVRYAPDGQVDYVLDMPVSQPTNVAFGGPELNFLFVTTARDELSEDQLWRQISAGDVFVYSTGFKGLPEPRFRPRPLLGSPS